MKQQTFIAIGPNCWGVAGTMRIAVKNARANWPRWTGRLPAPQHFSIWMTNAPASEVKISNFDGHIEVPNKYRLDKLQTSDLAE